MAEQPIVAPTPEELKAQEEAKAQADAKALADAKDAKPQDLVTKEVKEPKLVPEAALLEYKKEAKELAKEVKELKKLIEDGANRSQVSEDIKELAAEFSLPEEVISKLVDKAGEAAASRYEKEIEAKLKPLQDKLGQENTDKAFDTHFDKLMEAMPEFKDIASRDVIKTLSLDPKNASKPFSKILEEAYGHLVTGKKTIEKTQTRGGVSDAPIDFNRAKKDMEYYREIMDNPELKKKYNESLVERLRL